MVLFVPLNDANDENRQDYYIRWILTDTQEVSATAARNSRSSGSS